MLPYRPPSAPSSTGNYQPPASLPSSASPTMKPYAPPSTGVSSSLGSYQPPAKQPDPYGGSPSLTGGASPTTSMGMQMPSSGQPSPYAGSPSLTGGGADVTANMGLTPQPGGGQLTSNMGLTNPYGQPAPRPGGGIPGANPQPLPGRTPTYPPVYPPGQPAAGPVYALPPTAPWVGQPPGGAPGQLPGYPSPTPPLGPAPSVQPGGPQYPGQPGQVPVTDWQAQYGNLSNQQAQQMADQARNAQQLAALGQYKNITAGDNGTYWGTDYYGQRQQITANQAMTTGSASGNDLYQQQLAYADQTRRMGQMLRQSQSRYLGGYDPNMLRGNLGGYG